MPSPLSPALVERPVPATPARSASDARGLLPGAIVIVLAIHLGLAGWLSKAPRERGAVVPDPPIVIRFASPPAKPPEPAKVERPKPLPPQPKPKQVVHRRPPPRPQPVIAPPPVVPVPVAPSVPVVPVKPAPPLPSPPLKVTQPFGRVGYQNNPPPQYPGVAAEMGWQGQVLLRVHVLASGRPDGVEVLHSSGHPPLDQAAMAAVRHWLFAPARRGATPIDGYATVPIDFSISN